MAERPAAFLDRDGVINEERNYVHRIEDFEFLPGVLDACRRFVRAGYLLVVVTNQAGIARGYYGVEDFEALSAWMRARFSEAGAPLSGIYFCPHHPDGSVAALRRNCDCRKPAPGLLFKAARELEIDLARSFLVGDKLSDIEAGVAAGVARRFLIGRPGDDGPDQKQLPGVDAVVSSLTEVADWLEHPARRQPSPPRP